MWLAFSTLFVVVWLAAVPLTGPPGHAGMLQASWLTGAGILAAGKVKWVTLFM